MSTKLETTTSKSNTFHQLVQNNEPYAINFNNH